MPRALRIAAILIVVGFSAYALWRGGRDLPDLPPESPSFWRWLALAYGLYVASQVLAARAWSGTLAVFSTRLPPGRAETQLLVSQIGKYVPGNVAHLLGRFSLARADGVAGPVAGVAMVLEIALVLTAGGLLLLLFLLFAPDLTLSLLPGRADLPRLSSSSIPFILLLAAAMGTGLWLAIHQIRRRGLQITPNPLRAAMPFSLHLFNFLLLGLSLACVVQAIAPAGPGAFLLPVPVFVVAWSVGFLMPGSPGGIGTREGLIAFGLGAVAGEGVALTAALLHRAICILGDLTVFALAYRLR